MLKWVFGVDSGPFRRGLSDMRRDAKGFGQSLKGIFSALGIGIGVQQLRAFAQEMDRVGKLATRMGVSAEEIQKLKLASEVSGASIEQLQSALTKATVAATEATQGLKTYERAFESLNIDAAEFANASPTEKIQALAGAFGQAENEAEAFSAIYRILGKQGAELLPLLREGPEGLRKLFEGTNVVADETVRKIEQMNDAITKLNQNVTAFKGKLASGGLELAGVGGEMAKIRTDRMIRNPFSMLDPIAYYRDAQDAIAANDAKRVSEENQRFAAAQRANRFDKQVPLAPAKPGTPKFLKAPAESSPGPNPESSLILGALDSANKGVEMRQQAREQAAAAGRERRAFLISRGAKLRGDLEGVPEPSVRVSDLQAAGGGDVGGYSNAMALQRKKVSLLEQIAKNTALLGSPRPAPRQGSPLPEPRG